MCSPLVGVHRLRSFFRGRGKVKWKVSKVSCFRVLTKSYLVFGEEIMMGILKRVCVFSVCALVATASFAQDIAGESGVPGDGIPDFYYFPSEAEVLTSDGLITGTAGTVVMDTDGVDAVAFFIGGADISVDGCALCDGMNMPGTDALAGTSAWTVGFSAGSTQWIRTNPLAGRGFVGVVGESYVDGDNAVQAWPEDVPPFLNFSDAGAGVGDYGLEATFDAVFAGPQEGAWQVQLGTDDGRGFFTNVSVVPEPASFLLSLAGLALLGLRRR